MADIYKKNDSIKVKFMKAATVKHASTGTKKKMTTTFNRLEAFAKKQRYGAFEPTSMTAKQAKNYVEYLTDELKLNPRSIQNETSHIRRALEAVDREAFAQITCSNKNLGAPKGTRIGSGKVVQEDVLKSALERAPASTKALIELSRALGLRIREAVLSQNSLRQWNRDLSKGQPVIVRDGTKGGRARAVVVAPGGFERAQEAVKAALAVLKTQNTLVVSVSLKAALEQHSDRLARLGLKKENSCHSLRRAFAMDQYRHYLAVGYSEKVALSWTSNDLGHGERRGRWVYNNYLKASLKDMQTSSIDQ